MKWLPYGSFTEAITRKISSCDIDFLKELNPTMTGEAQRRRPGHRPECEAL